MDGVLAGTTHTYQWLADLTDGQIGVELASFQVEFLGENYLPYFEPALSGLIQIEKKEVEAEEEDESWEFILPDFFDENINDEVTLSVDLTNVESFMSFNEVTKAFEIENLADAELPVGTFKVIVTLSDGTESRQFNVSIVIDDSSTEENQDEEAQLDQDSTSTEDEADDDDDDDELTENDSSGDSAMESAVDRFVFDWRAAFLKKEDEMRASGSLFKLKPPKPTLSFIKETGEVQINFNQQMQILPSLDMIKEGKMEIDGQVYKAFDIVVIPAEGQDQRNVAFDWVVSEMTQRGIRLKLVFKDAVYVSTQMEPDFLEVVFRDRYLFVAINNLAISTKPISADKRILASASSSYTSAEVYST